MKKLISLLFVLLLSVSLVACASSNEGDANETELKKATLILDYVPNTNHTGFYVALNKGFYKEAGIDLEIIEPGNDATSATLVATGKGQFGVSYQEDVTYALTSAEPLPIKAIATIIEHNTSGFVWSKDKDIKDPKDFENKVFSVWPAPSADAVMKAVMTAYGADYNTLTTVNDEDGGFESLNGNVDIKWFFKGWDLIRAEMEGYDFNYLPLGEVDKRLDYYTPVIISNLETIENDKELAQKFMSATKKGYEYAIANPKESAEILHEYASEYDLEFLIKSQEYLSSEYAKDKEVWGVMKDEVWDNYTEFMYENGLISEKISADKQYTNEFIK